MAARTGRSSEDTRRQLVDGAISALRDHGFAGTSARSIAQTAGVNQALIFYHFGSVNELVAQACFLNTRARVDSYTDDIAGAESMTDLVNVGRRIHENEHRLGNLAVLAQVLAGAQQHPELATVARDSLQLWIDVLHTAITRMTGRSVLDGLVDTQALARLMAAAFIGVALYEGTDPSGAGDVFAALQPLCLAADAVGHLNPVVKKALRSQLTRSAGKAAQKSSGGTR